MSFWTPRFQVIAQSVLYRSTLTIGNLIAWSFIPILIYKRMGEISPIFLNAIVYFLGIWLTFIISSFLMEKIGILRAYRLSFFIQGIAALAYALAIDSFVQYYLILSFISGLGEGFFWPIFNYFRLNEVTGSTRTAFINSMQSLGIILGILIPVFAGALIDFSDTFFYSFALVAVLYFITASFPFTFNRDMTSKISFQEIKTLLSKTRFQVYQFFALIGIALREIITWSFAIIPFLLLQSEFGVGVLNSAIGIVAAIAIFVAKSKSLQQRLNFAFVSLWLQLLVNTVFVVFWSTPVLFFRSLLSQFLNPFISTARSDLKLNITEKILGKSKEESAIELNLVNETVILAARLLGLGGMFVILESFSVEQAESVIKIALVLASTGLIFTLQLLKKLYSTKVKA